MSDKSLLRITRPRETYVDGYGVERTFDEPKVVTKGRKVWDAGKRFLEFLEGDKTWTAPDGQQYPITQGAGVFEALSPNPVGKLDDVAKLAKNLDKFKMDELRRFKLRRKINQQPKAKKRIFRNADRHFPNMNDPYDIESNIDYIENRLEGPFGQYMDILWRRGDLDGVKHPKVDYTYEDLPF